MAVVVPRGGARPTLREIREHLLDRGQDPRFLPDRLDLVEALPKTLTGKVKRPNSGGASPEPDRLVPHSAAAPPQGGAAAPSHLPGRLHPVAVGDQGQRRQPFPEGHARWRRA